MWSFSNRTPVVALAVAIGLLLAGVVMAVYNERATREQAIYEITVQGRTLARIVAPALIFQDRQAARDFVDAFAADQAIEAVAVYDAPGNEFAAYSRANAQPAPPRAPQPGIDASDDRLVFAAPVSQGHEGLGTVYLRSVTEPLAERARRYVGIGILVTMAALVVAVLGAAHSDLTRANAELTARAVELGEANRNLQREIEEREKAEEALRQSQKMEAIGRLTGGVAHDFNNLLTVVGGNLDMIEQMASAASAHKSARRLSVDRLQRLVTAAQRGISRGERLTRQLLSFSRQRPLQVRTIDINAAIADFGPFVQRALGEAIELRLDLGSGEWLCDLDPAQFEAAILNLAINARDAITGSGSLTIATSRLASAAGIAGRPPEWTGRPCIAITVSDTGAGMSPQTLRRIFEPFYTTKPAGKGSGLGLAQVWAFVTQSGGWAAVDSALGKGTTFRLYLPLSEEAEADAEENTAAGVVTGGSEAILVVEDEEDVLDVAATTLRQLGYRTTVAHDGREALDLLRNGCEADLLFSDFVMPNGLNGAELARKALECRPGLKVLLTSGYIRHGEADDADGFTILEKPYRVADLAARIRAALDDDPTATGVG
jgi:signal transduction histidine kinase